MSSLQHGVLYLVPTPIGNLGDMTFRAIDTLRFVDVVYCEDTRVSKVLLQHFDIRRPLFSFHSQNEHRRIETVLASLETGQKVALITDAGTPGISDPAYLLVRACRDREIPVYSLPGPTAFVPALVMSGLPCEKFFFQGFLPHKKGRRSQWAFLASLPCTIVLYESPHRLIKCLEEILFFAGPDRQVFLAREISKQFEQHFRGTAVELIEQLSERKILGEWVVIVAGSHP